MWHLDCSMIILHATEPRVLLLPGAAGWVLPQVSIEVEGSSDEMHVVRSIVRERFGLEVTGLRRLYIDVDDQAQWADVIQFLENHSAISDIAVGQSFGREQLAELPLARPDMRTFVDLAQAEATGAPTPDQRTPWARLGWFSQAAAWFDQQLAQHGYTLEMPIEQFRSSSISCVLRARTDRGDLYFKTAAALPIFGDEPALTQALAERFAEVVPTILASEPAHRWMIMTDFGQVLEHSQDVAIWADALRQFGLVQLACATCPEDLLAIGCLDRRLDRLLGQVHALLDDGEALAELDAAEADRLRVLEPKIAMLGEQLARYHVPQTLVHGDLHLGNIATGADRFCFFDWTDACIAHPFFDLVTMLNSAADFLGSFEVARARLASAYLSVWTAYEPIERLHEACTLALPFGALHQAVSYRHIHRGVEAAARAEWDGATGYWLRKALELMPQVAIS